MAEPEAEGEEAPKKKSKLPLIIGLVLMLLLGGGAFYALYSGMILAPPPAEGADAHEEVLEPDPLPEIAFIPLDPMVISLPEGQAKHLRFTAQLEVPLVYQQEVELVKPRVLDVLNGFLRAVSVKDLENPAAMMRLRAQMLRRVQVVVGQNKVNDLLVIEFVMN
ncbi:flagellar basal body protein FliL [Rhodobacter sp. TJ_12]|uniref:flagellar basal body-associated FliL family protein n=1 Tax=Rhodobacter sp. TJ_12 TaxID=2029399 RepID=UPI001CBF888C|nr:flagellar basal body-associated FliL family protein [Rhodobacter sp. TJ_12]MBZ4023652.1 flagellar basal body protein FliL [Rhodobacter sp. TJ_12]